MEVWCGIAMYKEEGPSTTGEEAAGDGGMKGRRKVVRHRSPSCATTLDISMEAGSRERIRRWSAVEPRTTASSKSHRQSPTCGVELAEGAAGPAGWCWGGARVSEVGRLLARGGLRWWREVRNVGEIWREGRSALPAGEGARHTHRLGR